MASQTKTSSTDNQVLSGADILVQSLVNHGVEVIFAYPGGFSMPLHQALTRYSDKIRTVLPRHEQGCGFGAHGYARSTGKVGVCMSTSGPGATNLVTTIADAKMDSVPMVAITGQVGTAVIGTDAFQETPIVEVCRGITKHHYLVTHIDDLTRVLREAFHVASTGRPGPVLVDLPKDVQLASTVPDWEPPMDLPGYRVNNRRASADQIKQVADAIKKANRPVLYVGGGIITSDASEELREFVKKTGIPVAMTLNGLGSYPNDDPLSLDMLGMHGTVYSNYAISDSDLLLAFGVRFDDRATGKLEEFASRATIVHVDVDPSEINKNKEAHIPIVANVKEFLVKLNETVEPPEDISEWTRRCAKWKKEEPLRFGSEMLDTPGILPQHAISELSRLTTDRETFITTGVGQHQMWTAQYYQFKNPRTMITSGGLGTMGFGIPAALGIQLAHPDALVVNVDGDGSIMMNIQELATYFCEKLPVKVLLLNNQHLGMVAQWEDRFMAGNRAHTFLGPIDKPEATGKGSSGFVDLEERFPNFVQIANGMGCGARCIHDPEDLTEALQEMIDFDGPYVLDVQTPYSEHVLPMIPANGTIRDLIKE